MAGEALRIYSTCLPLAHARRQTRARRPEARSPSASGQLWDTGESADFDAVDRMVAMPLCSSSV